MKKEDWFQDNREGLHCCFCHDTKYLGNSPVLYNNKIAKHIVCGICLQHLLRINGRYALHD